jgi:hypothetical protein
VHPDQVSFEAFSLDESIYGCLSIELEEFDIIGTPKLGTTNIDFSIKLANEIQRFRSYNDVELSVNPEGLTVDTGVTPEYIEKKIDLPESWIKGFNQVSSASSMGGKEIEIAPTDMYDICSFLRRHKAHTSPRSMRWVLKPNEPIRIIFEPWGKELVLSTIYDGKEETVERIWGRRRWLVVEKLIPIAQSFRIVLLGFGLPQFIIANLGSMKLTIGFTSWSANDWVKGTAFNILAGFIGDGNQEVFNLLKQKRLLSIEEIKSELNFSSEKEILASIGETLRKGEAYFDLENQVFRFRKLLNFPIPKRLYERTVLEIEVLKLLENQSTDFDISKNDKDEIVAKESFMTYRKRLKTSVVFDLDGQIEKVKCQCREFKKGPRNISAPCSHILTIYIRARKFLNILKNTEKKDSKLLLPKGGNS